MLAEADPRLPYPSRWIRDCGVSRRLLPSRRRCSSALLPAWQATATDVGARLQGTGSRRDQRPAAAVAPGACSSALQLALSLPLLVGAGLLARTAYNVQRVDLGFAVDNLLTGARRPARDDRRSRAARRDASQALLERYPPGARRSHRHLLAARRVQRRLLDKYDRCRGLHAAAGPRTRNDAGCRRPELLHDARHAPRPGPRHRGTRYTRRAHGLRRQRSLRGAVLLPPERYRPRT